MHHQLLCSEKLQWQFVISEYRSSLGLQHSTTVHISPAHHHGYPVNRSAARSPAQLYQLGAGGQLKPLVITWSVCLARDPANDNQQFNHQCMVDCFQYPPQCDFNR